KNRLKDRRSTAEWTGHAVAFYADTQVKPGRRRASVNRTRTAANEDRFRLKGKAVCMESFPQPRESYESDYRFVKRLGGDAIEKCHDWRPVCHRRDAQERGCVKARWQLGWQSYLPGCARFCRICRCTSARFLSPM